MNIIFDLDGTLIDSSERMYRLFQKLVPESGFSKEEYWKLKRNKINHRMILERYFPSYSFEEFNKEWLNRIEENEYLDLDSNYPDTIQTLLEMKKRGKNLILLTARQSKENLLREINRLELIQFFSSILVTQAKSTKTTMLKRSGVVRNPEKDLFVSDMGKDIVEGHEMGYRTVAISHGFMNKERLMEYQPTYIVESLKQLIEISDSLGD